MVVIEDMDLPAGCALCRLKDNHYKECNVTHRRIVPWIDKANRRPEWCPLRGGKDE